MAEEDVDGSLLHSEAGQLYSPSDDGSAFIPLPSSSEDPNLPAREAASPSANADDDENAEKAAAEPPRTDDAAAALPPAEEKEVGSGPTVGESKGGESKGGESKGGESKGGESEASESEGFLGVPAAVEISRPRTPDVVAAPKVAAPKGAAVAPSAAAVAPAKAAAQRVVPSAKNVEDAVALGNKWRERPAAVEEGRFYDFHGRKGVYPTSLEVAELATAVKGGRK